MATNYTNTTVKTITNAKTLVPVSSNGTGTISTNGKSVIGVGTLFKTEMPAGSWLVDLAANEFRKIHKVENDTVAYLEQAFTVNIAALTVPNILHQKKAYPCEIGIVIPVGNAAGTIITTESSSLPSGLPVNLSKANRDETMANDLVNPCIVDATGTVAIISIIY